jgi:septal ring factor EnvC (AmiA/AmiB activator)
MYAFQLASCFSLSQPAFLILIPRLPFQELQAQLDQANAAKEGLEQSSSEQLKELQGNLANQQQANEQLSKQLADLQAQLNKASGDGAAVQDQLRKELDEEKARLEGAQKELSEAKKENAVSLRLSRVQLSPHCDRFTNSLHHLT